MLEEELDEKEIYYIKQFDCIVPNGYNIKDYTWRKTFSL